MKNLIAFLLVCCFFSFSINAQVIYVDIDARGSGSGKSWSNAYTDLQSALTNAPANSASVNSSIWVAAGTYKPTVAFDTDGVDGREVREKTFYINKNLKIYGGFAGHETILSQRDWVANPTILSGNIGMLNDNLDNAYHVVFMDGTTNSINNFTVFEGFHITHGFADKLGGIDEVPFNSFGGAIFHNGRGNGNECSPYILNCKIYDNYGSHFGAVYNDGHQGISSPEIINCSFYDNQAGQLGGALVNDGRDAGESHPKIRNCTFYNNTTFSNSNSGIYNLGEDGAAFPDFYNCIIWNNGDEIINDNGSASASLYYCIFDDGNPDGNLMLPIPTYNAFSLDLNPLFKNVGNKDFRISETSPAYNSGYNYSIFEPGDITTIDLAGNPRNIGGAIDRGAYESLCAPENIFVNINAAPGGYGDSWSTAFTDLQDAIDLANICSTTEIWVATGTYLPTKEFDADGAGSDPREKTFYINRNVEIYGGFVGNETTLGERDWKNNPTILSGDLGTPNDDSDNAYHVIYLNGKTSTDITDACILDGFTIKDGKADSAILPNNNGGGIYSDGGGNGNESSPSISNCTFENNSAINLGGAINIRGNSNGIGNPTFTNCIFSKNTANLGGAVCTYGHTGTTLPAFTNCMFSENTSNLRGGAIYNLEAFGMGSSFMTNCTFYKNTAGTGGGAIHNFQSANMQYDNCIFWENTSTSGADEIMDDGNNTTTLNHSLIEGTNCPPNVTCTGSTNIFAMAPSFVDAVNGDLGLQNNSPARNTGNKNATGLSGITTDLAGNFRIVEMEVDMGAYENRCASDGDIIYVNAAVSSEGDGFSWANAFSNLQDGIDVASTCGGAIWVAAGTYLPTEQFDADSSGGNDIREKTFYINKNIQIYGGFAGGETILSERDWVANPTILSGEIGVSNNDFDNAYHVVFIDGTTAENITNLAIIDGFNIIKGRANGTGLSNTGGGGIYNNGRGMGKESSPSILNCTFSNNSGANGGAIYNHGSRGVSSPKITNCIFSNNAAISGGAINNSGFLGVSNPKITNCIFSNNAVTENGGAVYTAGDHGETSPIFINSLFYNNTAGSHGGAFGYDDSDIGRPQFTNCTFDGNTAGAGGIIGIRFWDSEMIPLELENCIGWNNSSTLGGNGNISINYSLIQESSCPSGATCSNTIFNQNPFFVDESNDNFRLQISSPAKNTGNKNATGLSGIVTDLYGNQRVVDGEVDMGAYENKCPSGDIIYVDATVSHGDGTSWASAFTDLQDGIDLASICGGEIWVAKGIYKPTVEFDGDDSGGNNVREKTFYINKNIQIYGGFAGGDTLLTQRDWITNLTTLSGDIDNSPNDSTMNAYHVMFIDGTTTNGIITNSCIVDGFNIVKGNADGSTPNNKGGGIYNKGNGHKESSPSILNCSFIENTAADDGGAIYNNGNNGESSPDLTNCFFWKNIAADNGGAIYNRGLNGVSSPKLTNCSFSENRAVDNGGAIYNDGASSGLCSPKLTNCSFSGNMAADNGGAIRNYFTTNVAIENCILWNNPSTNGQDEIADNQSIPSKFTAINYSIIEGGKPINTTTGIKNLFTNPLFVSTSDLRLQNNSPAINAGNNTAIKTGITTDLDGNERIINGTVDMGAYENNFCLTIGNIYVNHLAASGGDGKNWRTAFTDLQDGIDIASICGGEIWVAAGTYLPTVEFDGDDSGGNNVREKAFYINKDIQIYGGFDGTENTLSERNWENNLTILSGDIGTVNDNTDNAYHIIYLDGTTSNNITNACILDGFTISDGYASSSTAPNGIGAGLYNSGNGSGNECSPTILNCIFSDNYAITSGAAIFNNGEQGTSSPIITNSLFNNNSTQYGGAITNNGFNGGTSSTQITNCSFYNNTASHLGDAIRNRATTNVLIENSIFWNNNTTTDEIADDGNNGTTVNYSIVAGGCPTFITCDSVLNVDPQFVDTENDNFHLQTNSLAINAGNNGAMGLTNISKDLDGKPRFASPMSALMLVDIGAYEVQTIAGADMDMDGIIDILDNCPNNANAGLDLDGTNDFVTVPNHASLNFTDVFTVEAWINASSWKSGVHEGTIVGKDGNTNGFSSGYVLRCGNNGQLSFVVGTGGEDSEISTEWPEALSSQNALSLNTWHHVVGVLSDLTLKIYIDGLEVGSTAITDGHFGNSTSYLLIGASPAFSGRHFQGKIDEVRLWNTARTEQALRGNLLKEVKGDESGLVAYYKFNEGIPNADNTVASSTITDHSLNSNNGALTNFAQTGITSNWGFGGPLNLLDSDDDGLGDACDCEISVVSFTITECINNESSTELSVDGINVGATYTLSGDLTGTYTYNEFHAFYNLPDTLNFTITDISNNCQSESNNLLFIGCSSFYDCTEDSLVFENSALETATYSAINTLTSESIIESQEVVIFTAGTEITLKPGFVAHAGSDFTAEIVACNPSPAFVEEESEERESATPDDTKIADASMTLYPNPTRFNANIELTIPESGNHTLAVYNNTGTMIKLLADNQWIEGGQYTETLETAHLPAGFYVVVLHAENQTITKKLMVID